MRALRLAARAALLPIVGTAQIARADEPLPPGITIVDGLTIINPKVVLAAPFQLVTYRWKNGSPAVVLPTVDKAMCLLTGVTGKFLGAGERVSLYQQNGRWMLGGTSGQKELAAEATCALKIHFLPAVVNPQAFTSKIYGNHTNGNCGDHIVKTDDDVNTRAYFITGIAGKFRGGGEMVSVFRDGSKSAIKVNGCSGYVDGTLASFGDLTTGKAFFRNKKGERSLLFNGALTTFAATDSGLPSQSFWCSIGLCGLDTRGTLEVFNPTILAPVEEALCGLVTISGKLQGYGEEVKIVQTDFQGSKWWALLVRENGEDAVLNGAARCLSRDQRPLIHFPD